jgi:Pentapeptide repeats (8 copies)
MPKLEARGAYDRGVIGPPRQPAGSNARADETVSSIADRRADGVSRGEGPPGLSGAVGGCRGSGAKVSGAKLSGTKLWGAKLWGAELSGAKPRGKFSRKDAGVRRRSRDRRLRFGGGRP